MVPSFLKDAFFKRIGQDEDCQKAGYLYLSTVNSLQEKTKEYWSLTYPGETLHDHHILPKGEAFWPEYENCKENLIAIPVSIHFKTLHNLLIQCFPKGLGKKGKQRGLMILTCKLNIDKLLKDPSFQLKEDELKFYQYCKNEMKGIGNPMYGTRLMHRWDEIKGKWIEKRRLPDEFPLNENWILGKAPNKEREINNMYTITPKQQAMYDALENLIQSRIAEVQKSLDKQIEDIQDVDELRRLSIKINLQMANLLDIPFEISRKMKGRPSPFKTFMLDNLSEINNKLYENIQDSAIKDCVFSTQLEETADMVRERIQKALGISPKSAKRIYRWYMYYKKSDWKDPSMKNSILANL